MPRPCAFMALAACLFLALFAVPGSVQALPFVSPKPEPFEHPYNLVASRILPPALLTGPHHRVEEAVLNDGYMNFYTVRSRYGQYKVTSTALLAQRVDEFASMAAMDKASGAQEFGKGVWDGGVSVVMGVKNLVTEPVKTLGDAASGVGKLFSRADESMNGSPASKYEDSTGAKLTGFASSRREYAVAYGVDPYSANQPMQERLRSVAGAGYAGGLTATGLKVLIPGGVGIAVSSVGGVSWLKEADLALPPAELRMQNRQLLQSMGIQDKALTAFMDNAEFTPTQQTLLVKYLNDMRRAGSKSEFLRLAAQVADQDQANFTVRMARMYAGYHRVVSALRGFTPVGALPGAVSSDRRLVLCFPLDHLCWTKNLSDLTKSVEAALERHNVSGVELWLTGTVSPAARKALTARKWTIREKAGKELMGESM